MISSNWFICHFWCRLDSDSFSRDVNLGVFRDFKNLIFADFFCDPVSLLSCLKCNDLLSEVKCALDVQILVLLSHSRIMNDKLDTFIDIVRIFQLLSFGHLQSRHYFLWWSLFDLFLNSIALRVIGDINLGLLIWDLFGAHASLMLTWLAFRWLRLDDDRHWCANHLLALVIWGT